MGGCLPDSGLSFIPKWTQSVSVKNSLSVDMILEWDVIHSGSHSGTKCRSGIMWVLFRNEKQLGEIDSRSSSASSINCSFPIRNFFCQSPDLSYFPATNLYTPGPSAPSKTVFASVLHVGLLTNAFLVDGTALSTVVSSVLFISWCVLFDNLTN